MSTELNNVIIKNQNNLTELKQKTLELDERMNKCDEKIQQLYSMYYLDQTYSDKQNITSNQ
ncbi:hypothetical protein ENUP19_0248G0110 [Entamoeba nuttalli]|uniref:Uncharacterized protein n=1 Tax=Entamoeba nuttalli TaxID=412467 RepID=A0ABQ0DR52_9EUKA